ncbi:MAG: hypothetical protein OXD42_05510 [Rhodospirillaceae bacterium]|nr:hypothetical protein [Rhodospirillaceae bacterium]
MLLGLAPETAEIKRRMIVEVLTRRGKHEDWEGLGVLPGRECSVPEAW